ncbi:tripartite motif-containing protein 2/3 [Mytilus galloprovincialis]|uniref:Tripartite motif-containing protein 2/3 n=1 Tax=Mytilus galloprovincialis TaxID=29158 RepID=A0A8B6GV41_MYTGA|nr:tripartite motif-containing protein 2/3 [Mytilus galloprovincialis]
MATAVNESDIFTCPICLEKLKSPKSLPCSHSFCEVCIGEFILSTERRTGHTLSNYPCPVCDLVVTPSNLGDETSQWASSLPQNVTLSAQLDQSETTKQECHLCKTESIQHVATHWCRDCSDAFCDNCLRIHNRMKILGDHKVVKIEDISTTNCASGGESDFCFISYKCSVHNSKMLEAFCFDHQELCCVLCLTLQHRKCENIKAIEEMTDLSSDGIESFESKLKEVIAKVDELVEERKNKHEKLESYFKDIELAAKTSAASIKDRIDVLLSSFLEELRLTGNEHKSVSKEKLKTVENLMSSVVSLMNTTKSVQVYGSLIQMFVHLNKSKSELKYKVQETNKILNADSVEEAIFAINEQLHQVEKEDQFGKIEVYCNVPIKVNSKVPIELNKVLNVNPLDIDTIQSIKLRHKKTMSFAFYVNAICIMDNVILVGGRAIDLSLKGELNAVDWVNGTCVANTTCEQFIKRLACDTESLTIFFSSYSSTIHTFKLQEGIFKSHKKKENCRNPAGLCIFDGFMYIITENELQKMNIKETDLQKCFNTNTKKCSLNQYGLATDLKNKRLLYTSDTDEVVATTTDGSEHFCYTDEHMKNIVAVAVNNQGCIVACDQTRTLHVISEDGKKRKTLSDKFDKIKESKDVCFDKSGTILYICGDQFVEEYEILY